MQFFTDMTLKQTLSLGSRYAKTKCRINNSNRFCFFLSLATHLTQESQTGPAHFIQSGSTIFIFLFKCYMLSNKQSSCRHECNAEIKSEDEPNEALNTTELANRVHTYVYTYTHIYIYIHILHTHACCTLDERQ